MEILYNNALFSEDTKGEYTVVVEGSAKWKETITVKQKRRMGEIKKEDHHNAAFIPVS